MTASIFKRNPLGELEEVVHENIRHWCQECQFPYGRTKCQGQDLVQRCWFELQAIANTLKVDSETHIWHLQHECPFIQEGLVCGCNEFQTVEQAFQALSMEYKKGEQNGKVERGR